MSDCLFFASSVGRFDAVLPRQQEEELIYHIHIFWEGDTSFLPQNVVDLLKYACLKPTKMLSSNTLCAVCEVGI